MEGDGKSGEQGHPVKFFATHVGRLGVIGMQGGQGRSGRLFVGVFFFWDKVINQTHQQDSQKEESHIHPDTLNRSVNPGEGSHALLKNFHEGHVEHDPGRKPCGDGKESVVGLFGHEGDDAADAGGHSGKERQPKGDPERAQFHARIDYPERGRNREPPIGGSGFRRRLAGGRIC